MLLWLLIQMTLTIMPAVWFYTSKICCPIIFCFSCFFQNVALTFGQNDTHSIACCNNIPNSKILKPLNFCLSCFFPKCCMWLLKQMTLILTPVVIFIVNFFIYAFFFLSLLLLFFSKCCRDSWSSWHIF